jgi:hypothetical protein
MEFLGEPFSIQNTADQGWLVTWNDAVTVRSSIGEVIESVSFTVAVPRNANLSISEVQRYASRRAVELLQSSIKGQSQAG